MEGRAKRQAQPGPSSPAGTTVKCRQNRGQVPQDSRSSVARICTHGQTGSVAGGIAECRGGAGDSRRRGRGNDTAEFCKAAISPRFPRWHCELAGCWGTCRRASRFRDSFFWRWVLMEAEIADRDELARVYSGSWIWRTGFGRTIRHRGCGFWLTRLRQCCRGISCSCRVRRVLHDVRVATEIGPIDDAWVPSTPRDTNAGYKCGHRS